VQIARVAVAAEAVVEVAVAAAAEAVVAAVEAEDVGKAL